MKWINANERLPEIGNMILWRLKDKTAPALGYYKEGFRYGIDDFLSDPIDIKDIEWLDESTEDNENIWTLKQENLRLLAENEDLKLTIKQFYDIKATNDPVKGIAYHLLFK